MKRNLFVYSSKTSKAIAFLSSFIVGLGDSSLNTQIMNVLVTRYKQCTASAFAIFRLVQSLMIAVAFSYAGSLQLQWQLLVVVIFLFFGTFTFFKVLFDETESEFIATSGTITLQVNEHDSYQNYSLSIA
ncbi:unnamed protein product [Rotaria sordida]|uniref:Uncharacterized protein n=1 Tax=Rotaria sordida TaxID=392033 RepID=A0A814CI02_9BILA|nr:unnamed protein product [Rotaria sordida]